MKDNPELIEVCAALDRAGIPFTTGNDTIWSGDMAKLKMKTKERKAYVIFCRNDEGVPFQSGSSYQDFESAVRAFFEIFEYSFEPRGSIYETCFVQKRKRVVEWPTV
jgi:hypothetical protein